MPTAFVQGAFAFTDASSQASQAVSFDSNVTAGNLIAVWVKYGTGASVFGSVTDNQGNTYTAVDTINSTGASLNTLKSFYAKNVAGGATTVTLNFTGSTGVYPRIMVHEANGCDTSAPLDGHSVLDQAGTTTGTDAISTGADTTVADGDLILGFTCDELNLGTPVVAGTAYTLRTDGASSPNNFDHCYSESKVQSTHGSVSANFSPSGNVSNYISSMMAFKPQAAVAAGHVQRPRVISQALARANL
jgi:hypothetical protein